MSAQETLAWEARWRTRTAVAAGVAAVLIFAGAIVGSAASSAPVELTLDLIRDHRHATGLIVSAILVGLGTVALAAPLLFLFVATHARRKETLPAFRFVAWFGPLALGIGQLAFQIVRQAKASTFVSHGDQTYAQAKHLVDSTAYVVPQYLGLAGSLALAIAFVGISLNAMRVGLLTRFMGIMGIIIGVALVLLGPAAPILQAFWLVALAALFLGRWPNGTPPAWETGEAVPWPSQQELREQRERDGGTKGDSKPAPEPVAEPLAAPAGEATGARVHPASKKRKRKRRR